MNPSGQFLLESGLALLLRAVQLYKLGSEHPCLKLGSVGAHGCGWNLRTAVAGGDLMLRLLPNQKPRSLSWAQSQLTFASSR